MNPFERTLGVNLEALQKLTEQAVENFEKYVEIHQDFIRRLPAVYGLDGMFELLQDYCHSVWQEACHDLLVRGKIVRHAVEKSGELISPRGSASGSH